MALATLMSVQFPSARQIAGAREQVEVAVLRCASSRRMRELPVCVRARGLKAVSRAIREDGDGGEPQDPSLPLLAADETLQRMGINVNLANDFEEEYEPVVHDKTSGFRPGLEVEGGYVGLFVRMLGLDNPAEDRERAVLALWRHSAAGGETVKEIVMFPGCLNLVVALLTSKREDTAEAAAALLRNISAIEDFRSQVAQAGALEEIAGLLTRHSISSEVRKQALCVLWNVSLSEEERKKVAGLELLPALLAIVDSEEVEEKDAAQMEAAGLRIRDSEEETAKEAAVGVLANFSYSPCNHLLLIEAGVIPILAKVLLEETSGSKVTRQEARTCLLNLAKEDPIQKSAIVEAGLVPVPLIGASAFRTFKPVMEDTFAIPEEDISFTPNPTLTTVFGADKLLRGLKIGNADDVDKTTVLLNEGKVRQQFLARIGVIEKKRVGEENNGEDKVILMPWWDGIARLVLILGLQNPSVAKKAAESLAEISITEDYRQAIHKAGAVPHLVKWLGSGDEAVTEAAALALDKLGKSQKVRRAIEAHGAVPALIEILRAPGAPQSAKERVVSTLLRFSQEGEGNEEALTQEGAIPGLMDIVSSDGFSAEAKEEAEGILEELSSRRPDSRVKIIAAGGLSPLIEMLSTGSPLQAEKAASVLENLATEQRNAEAMVKAGVESALLSRLDINVQEEGGLPDMDTWTSTIAASKLLEALVKHKSALEASKFASLLLRILQNATTPAEVKNWVSPCLRRLQQQGVDRDSLPIGPEITIHDRIPRLVEQLGVSSQQEAAVTELQELASQGVGAYSAAISSSGGIFPLVNLLENSTTPQASSAALAVLYNLGMDEENHVAMLAAGVAPPLQRWVKRGAPDWKLALYLLRTLPT